MQTIDDRQDGLALLSEGIALIQIQSTAMASGDLLPDSPQRRGFELMLDHAAAILLRAESKLSSI